ncbi:MAG TPA: hypothetical protein VFP58_13085, partial [Candidatus Eisenbacteria bacterium]|nr:hypothetical protein [Candidatus Eisenbacteria bacterium]
MYEFLDSLDGLYTSSAQGGNQRRIHSTSLGSPELAPDGAYLYYEHGTQIWRIPAVQDSFNSAAAEQVTNDPNGAFNPSVSYIQNRLAYQAGNGSGIYITSGSGGVSRHIGAPGWHDADWEPTDSALAFKSFG